jgi:hypothetical protein
MTKGEAVDYVTYELRPPYAPRVLPEEIKSGKILGFPVTRVLRWRIAIYEERKAEYEAQKKHARVDGRKH